MGKIDNNMGKSRLTIIIISYNTCDMTIECIKSLYKQDCSTDFEVIVVDNDSKDGSPDAIASEFPNIQLIRLDQNVGFARANNMAAKLADGERLLLLNPDTVILEQATDRLVSFADSNPDAGIWGGRTYFGDGSLNPTSCWQFMSLWSLFAHAIGLTAIWRDTEICNPEAYGGWDRENIRDVDIVTGCFFLVDRSLWETLGGFDDSFFMYAEEADLCFRARRQGAHPMFTPDAKIIHYGGASETVYSDKITKLLCGKISFLNKHWPVTKRNVGVNLFKLWALVRLSGYTVAALVTGSNTTKRAAHEWRQIWSRRHQWARGYPKKPNNDAA